ncbi:hypothetical protein PCYB_003690 [Plasmodium cynomolgi strain B]|uniref:CYIR protein n=1 Tax=Plasmodium cynomolgi (strain B) TaxID=1120755 RepID=K6V2U5_PLACD|nr:hypothetical protein PCYB_003690 [Plasmodium cynomolgi strain B]GAB69620.1 hypothetical protein PCYB_003690 [Plasmodium cynomolgi strain B]
MQKLHNYYFYFIIAILYYISLFLCEFRESEIIIQCYNFINYIKEYNEKLVSYSSSDNNYSNTECTPIISNYDINGVNKDTACRRVMGYLSHISQNDLSKESANKCKYLYYWMHYDLLKDQKESDQTLKLYNEFLQLYEKARNGRHLCNNYIEEISKIVVSNAKKLIELYNTFKNEQNVSNKCYCVCAKKCYDLHNKYAQECYNDNKDEDFCNELENFKYLYDRNMLYVGTCHNAPKTLVSVKPNGLHSPIIFPLMLALVMHSLLFILYKVNNAYYNTYI